MCPICYCATIAHVRAFDGNRLLPWPCTIHFCPTVQPAAANDGSFKE